MRLIKRIVILLLFLACGGGIVAWNLIFRENTHHNFNKPIKIAEGTDWEGVLTIFKADTLLRNIYSLDLLAKWTGYSERIKPGFYRLSPGMSNKEILQMLASGRQEEVKLVLRSSWSKENLITYVCTELTADSMYLLNLLNDSMALHAYGWNQHTILAAFIPNTYNFYWNTSAERFMERMLKEHARFWNPSRLQKAKTIGLSPIEVSIVASIVEKETNQTDEMSTVAGVYLNRLRKGMKLEADPTVKFAVGNPDIRRIRGEMLKIESPYNTYLYTGLPPGPICMPSIQAIDAVLKNEKHNYIYFCAREDFSGYHNFTADYDQHLVNARKYWLELNKKEIR